MAPSDLSRPSNRGLPAYQPPKYPLNESAQRALQNLSRDHKLDSLKTRLRATNNHLTNAAVDINERLQIKNAQYEKYKKRSEKTQEDSEQDIKIAKARQQAEEMTAKLEEGVRMIIDSSAKVEQSERALKELNENISEGNGRIPTSRNRHNNVRRRQGADLDDEESEFEHWRSESIDENDTPVAVMKQKLANEQSVYQEMSMAKRYAQHNDYVGFKKIVHDAQYPDDQAPPLANPSTWFTSQSPDPTNPYPSSAATTGNEAIVDDDDEDIVVASERISTKCPLTLLTMKDPVTSQKCPHSFEREAILSMLNASDVIIGGSDRRGAQGRQKAMKCPVCAVLLTASDLKENPVLVRKIQRLLAAESAENEEFSADEEEERPSLFGSNSRPQGISSSPAARTPRFKNERRSQVPGRQSRQVSMVPDSQVE